MTRALPKSCLPHIPETYHWQTWRAPQLPKGCTRAVRPTSGQFCPSWAMFGICCTTKAKFGRKPDQTRRASVGQHVARSEQVFARVTRISPTLANAGPYGPNLVRCWRCLTNISKQCPKCGQVLWKLGRRWAHGATCEHPLRNCGATLGKLWCSPKVCSQRLNLSSASVFSAIICLSKAAGITLWVDASQVDFVPKVGTAKLGDPPLLDGACTNYEDTSRCSSESSPNPPKSPEACRAQAEFGKV